ncbi:cytochrome P450 [Leucogyrophana mollusca]|uniref:Cytochrome P450 n=1 Tax=Leucogyrophana mollusca TaxID=85980 RepID=A0ACB8BAR3_9AGAM|nr:cytochrome P450 [Leucogyrophana mollusca]
MYTVGLQSAADAFLFSSLQTQVVLALFILFILLMFGIPTHKTDDNNNHSPVFLPGPHLCAIAPFFQRRFEFLNDGFRKTGQTLFQFNMLRDTVIVVSGESGRKAFFATKGFDLTEGFKVLSGAIPVVKGVTSDLQTRRIALIHKRLSGLQKNESLSRLIAPILQDCCRTMESWGPAGTFDPFEKIYELVFQTTVRSLSCEEIADDPALVSRLKKLYDTLDSGTTPATVLLPWLPGPSMIRKLLATKKIYDIIVHAIDNREKSGVSHDDALQMLLDAQDDRLVIVGFIMGLLVAGARATGTTASWLITFLGGHDDWKDKAILEVEQLLASYPPSTNSLSLSSHLSSIPLEAWEAETPVLDALIHETLRIAQPHTAMRRNLGPEVTIDSKTIPSGAYVVYPFSDVHLNPELYPDPWKFDPSREEVKAPFGYVGWGGGKTVCLGQRLARLELKLITSMFLLGFRYTIVDSTGQRPNPAPQPNWNDILLCRPDKQSCYLQHEKSILAL